MKQKIKLGAIILAITTVLIGLIFYLALTSKIEISHHNPLSYLSKEALQTNGSTTAGTITIKGAHDSQDFYKNGNFYYEGSPNTVNKVYIPSIKDIQLYCIEKGNAFKYGHEAVDTIKALAGTSHSIGCGSSLPADRYSNTYYVCTNNHSDLTGAAAYITTQPSNLIAPTDGVYNYAGMHSVFKKGENISKEVRQVAVWLNPDINQGENFETVGAEFTYLDMAKQLNEEAMDYKDYEQNLADNSSEPIKETTEDKVQINVNSKKQYMIIGPYKMDYIEGNSASAKFAGISNMVVKGYNDKKQQHFIKDVEIMSYIQNGEEKELKYFNPTEAEGYVDREEQSYPVSGEEFYIKIKNPNAEETKASKKVKYINIEVEYKYMTISGTKCIMEGHQLIAKAYQTSHVHDSDEDGDYHVSRHYSWKVSEYPRPQQLMMDAWGERNVYELKIYLNGKGDETELLDITMNLGGYVWEDAPKGKESATNGQRDDIVTNDDEKGDRALPNVKVTLYECPLKDGKLQYNSHGNVVSRVADLLSNADKNELTEKDMKYRANPTLTDEDGYYQFNGLDASNKYYVVFEYNGQVYLPTDYLVTDSEVDRDGETTLIHEDSVSDMVNAKLYNTDLWRITSKGTEAENEKQQPGEVTKNREDYNNQFEEIGSSPKNYESSNSLESGVLLKEGRRYYNETFSQNDLMGYILDEDGNYQADGVQLIDGFTEIQRGNIMEINTISEGVISRKIQKYISKYHEYPDEDALKEIYEDIVNEYGNNRKEKEELWRKLQFIEDCKIQAYTGSPFENGEVDLYPVYDDFTIDDTRMIIPGIGRVPPIYDGQYYVNLGLWRREQANISLRKDIAYAATRINGKTEVYKYDKRSEDDKYWEIQVRMQDYNNYYGTGYNRELYKADYEYKAALTNGGSDLELYVTYKVVVRNSSQRILARVTEVVDYYDKDYTYMPDLSWVMYRDNSDGDNDQVALKQQSYYNMMDSLDLGKMPNAREVDSSYSTRTNGNGNYNGESIYGENSQQDIEEELNSVYVRGLEDKKLAVGEQAYIYLTFKVNPDNDGPVILDDDNSLKENYAEINGYQTYYADGTKLPNEQVKSSRDSAGLVDMNSTPGNLSLDDFEGNKYERHFEDDTDRAKSIKVTVDENAIRNLNGIVWEDERTKTVSNAVLGDGNRQKDEIGINGVTVELVEKLANGNEFVWQTTTTKKEKIDGKEVDGYYRFSQFIPGNYIVRFQYGHNQDTVLTSSNGGKNTNSYNGQDFKSTVYQKEIDGQELAGYKEEYYNIQAADKLSVEGKNLSDAKDLWESKMATVGGFDRNGNYTKTTYQGRQTVNSYSSSNVTNHIAEVLAAPYASSINQEYINELTQKTNMVAETAVISMEGEYNRTQTDGYNSESNGKDTYYYGNDKNGNYTLNNVDFGLTERPKAQVELDQKVSNVKITLANGNILFDATQAVSNLIWQKASNYNLDDKMKKNKYEEYYNKNHRYAYRTEVDKLVAATYKNNGYNGLIQATMDEELMHGATIQISYELTVKNVGETDYTGQDFYYKATGAQDENKVTTTANAVINYVANNLQYREVDNKGWSLAKADDMVKNGIVNNGISEAVHKYNTILETKELANNLKPGETKTQNLVLTQVITPENTDDDKSYENIAEIVTISNTAGRRMAYSVQGNQDPTKLPAEVDSSKAERVVILPPFGSGYLYYGLGALVAIIIIAGIVFIQKKVLKKKD